MFFFIDVAKFSNTRYISKNNLGKILGLAISISDLKCVTGSNYVISLISLKRHAGFENANKKA